MGGIPRQYLAGITVNLATMASGCALGWTSPTLQKFTLPGAFLNPSVVQASWIGSLVSLGATIGPFPGGYLADKIGRRWTMLGLGIPFLLSWVLIISAKHIAMIYAGRFIAGIAIGAVYTVAPMYAGEVAEDSVRGALGSLLNVLVSAGFLYEYVIGPYVSYIWLGIISMIVPIAFVLSFFFMPESPYYLLMTNKKEEASKSLQWLRNSTESEVEKELEVMKESVDETNQQTGTLKDLFGTSGNRKAMYLSLGLVEFQVFCGIDAVLFYTTPIFTLSSGSISSEMSTIIVGTVMLVFAAIAPLIVEKAGRKPMLYVSGFGMAAAEFTLGTYFYYKDVVGKDLSSVGWLPVFCLVFFIAVFSIGYGPLPWAIMGELFPNNVKGLASAATASICWFTGFLITKYFQNIVKDVGMYGAFWIFGGCSILSNVFVYFLLPETKGKSLQEIQDILNKKIVNIKTLSVSKDLRDF